MPQPHGHNHTPPRDFGPALRRVVGLNTANFPVEATAGLLTGSLALIADVAQAILSAERPETGHDPSQ